MVHSERQLSPERKEGWFHLPVILVVGIVVLAAVAFAAFSLARPEPPTFAPSPTDPEPAGERLVGPRTFTVDASAPDRWRFFSFSQGTVVESPGPLDWDLAFRRFRIIVNGGDTFTGIGGAKKLGEVPLDSVTVLPSNGYEGTRVRTDSVAPVLERWYDYSFLSHLLSPRPDVYAVRTADGRYAAMEIVGYYCPGAQPGCVTIRYLYQGGGGRELAPMGEEARARDEGAAGHEAQAPDEGVAGTTEEGLRNGPGETSPDGGS